jgi:signal transduction histidine kinase/DNA-binding response OmpR family regulator
VKVLNWAQILQSHPILCSLHEQGVQWLLGRETSTERNYEPGAVILQEGEAGDSIFLIGSGSVEAVVSAEGGQTILLSVMREGDTFGEMAFFEGRERSATVKAREACVVLEIEAQAARRLLNERPDIGVKVLLKVSERLRDKNRQMLALFAAEQHARAEAEDANRAKDEFLAMLGHELRNPLGAISTAIHVLDTVGTPDDETARFRAIILRQTQHLSRMVEDLLDVSKTVSGKIPLHRRSEDLRALAMRVLSSFHEAGKTTQHVISLTGEPVRVDGDPTRLEQIVSNLLDNAVRYTPPGGRVEVTVVGEGPDVILKVRDTGIGIPPDMLTRIFRPFVQAHQTLDRSEGGLGLGLALVQRLVELHGGSVSASSAGPNRGSEFVVRLPRNPEATATPPSTRPESLPQRARHILLVEDNPDFRTGLRTLLELWGHRVEEAANGEDGLEIIRASHPEIVLVDLGLPDLDGYAVARSARCAPGGDAIVLIAITGYGRPEDRCRAEEAGFNAHLTKPIEVEELAQILSRAGDAQADQQHEGARLDSPGVGARGSPGVRMAVLQKSVLIVDDDPSIRSLFKEALGQQGYSTIVCGDGYEAFDFARAVVPHLVILDLRMGRGSGGVFLDYLSSSNSPILRQIPVLIVSGYLGEERGHDEGLTIVGRMEKPVALDRLVETVRDLIGGGTLVG